MVVNMVDTAIKQMICRLEIQSLVSSSENSGIFHWIRLLGYGGGGGGGGDMKKVGKIVVVHMRFAAWLQVGSLDPSFATLSGIAIVQVRPSSAQERYTTGAASGRAR